MATSLKQQLKKLAVPQASLALADAHTRASILFTPKEAATKDRRAIYKIGLNGLLELAEINPEFMQFKTTLFDEATITLERAVEKTDVNKLLDLNIAKFLRMLSPYFLLRSAHQCFEWLLRRFQVHQYNQVLVIALILPYHETNTFVQVLQTMPLSNSNTHWNWLHPVQKLGVPLSKTVIINRAASVPGFLEFICKSTQSAVKELGSKSNQLQTLINFYATVVVGALQTASYIEDWHILTILESLLKGLTSDAVDFVAASYVIVAQLVSCTKLKPQICNAFLERVANCTFERLHTTALLLLIWILDTQQDAKPEFNPSTMLNLICQKWLISSLSALVKENIATQALCMVLIRGTVNEIHSQSKNANSYQRFLNELITNVKFSKSSAQQLINCFLDSYVVTRLCKPTKSTNDDTIVIESDEEIVSDYQTWYTRMLEKLEECYPEAFDLSVKEALSTKSQSSNRKKALKLALGHRLKSLDEKGMQLYQKLYHYNPEWRRAAVEFLLANLKQKTYYKLMQEILPDRIKDDDAVVVAALLTMSTETIIDILGTERFAQMLCDLLKRIQQEQEGWQALAPRIVWHLTSAALTKSYDNNLVLLNLMPFIFPTGTVSSAEHEALLCITKSEFSRTIPFLREIKVPEEYICFRVNQYRQHFLEAISKSDPNYQETEAFNVLTILNSVERNGGTSYICEPFQLTHLLLLLTAYAKRCSSATESLHVWQRVSNYSNNFQFRLSGGKKDQPHHQKFVPLQLWADFLLALVQHTELKSLISTLWTEPNDELRLCLLLLDSITAQVYAERSNDAEEQAWVQILKEFLSFILPTPQNKFDFLSNFYQYETLATLYSSDTDYSLLRVRGFKLMQAVLLSKTKLDCPLPYVMRLANGCSSSLSTLRAQTLDTLELLTELQPYLQYFVTTLLERRSELTMDHEQYSLIVYTILQGHHKNSTKKLFISKLRRELLSLVCDLKQPAKFTLILLEAMKHLNDELILTSLLPLGLDMLNKIEPFPHQEAVKQLCAPYSDIYVAILDRFIGKVALNVLLRKPQAWQLITASFEHSKTFIRYKNKFQPLPCILLETLTPETYEQLPDKLKTGLLQLIVEASAQSDNGCISIEAHKLLKNCIWQGKSLVIMFGNMCSQAIKPNKTARTRNAAVTMQLDLTSVHWKQCIALLELIENKQHLLDAELLIPALFDMLQACLALEETSAAEHPKQLILSCLMQACEVAEAAGVQISKVVPQSSFRIEQVVNCLRTTQNPQTQQKTLMLLTRCAELYPREVLHKIVEIFTFIGSTAVRHDDAFSLQIINNVVLSVVPVLLQQGKRQQIDKLVISVLKVFSDICIDVPRHRRLPLYATLFSVMEPKQYLWQFLCLLFEAQMMLPTASKDYSRMEFAQELTLMFEAPQVTLETCIHLLDYVQDLPETKEEVEKPKGQLKSALHTSEHELFNVDTHSFKQLRHYRYIIMDYLSTITSNIDFQASLSKRKPGQLLEMKPYYQKLILKMLAFVNAVNKAVENASDVPLIEKYWRVIANHAHDVLSNAIGLLTPENFLHVIAELLQHDLLHVRIKILELLIDKLMPNNNYFDNCANVDFRIALNPLGSIIDAILQPIERNAQQAQFEQSVLSAVQMLASRFGANYIDECRTLLITLTRITKNRAQVPRAVVANVVLTLVEICAILKVQALAQLPKFMPHLTELLIEHMQQPPDYLSLALVTALQKLFSALPMFLGPYLTDIICYLVHLSTVLDESQYAKDKRAQTLQERLPQVKQSIVKGVEPRIFVPSCSKAYNTVYEAHNYNDLVPLMDLLQQSIHNNGNAELQSVQAELSELFFQAIQFRVLVKNRKISLEQVKRIEISIIDTFVFWILKLTETSLRPTYSKIYDWAMKSKSENHDALLTYFLLNNKMAESLKSLFIIFAKDIISDATTLLYEYNTLRPEFQIKNDNSDYYRELLSAILSTLHHVFLHNTSDFINLHRFNNIMPSIVDQLANKIVLEYSPLQQQLTDCIAQLAVAVSSDVMWKQLNNQVLLKTRSTLPEARILAFNTCLAIAQKLGEGFSPLLPETVPFIAELLEDESEHVEKQVRHAVRQLEVILGESLQKYL